MDKRSKTGRFNLARYFAGNRVRPKKSAMNCLPQAIQNVRHCSLDLSVRSVVRSLSRSSASLLVARSVRRLCAGWLLEYCKKAKLSSSHTPLGQEQRAQQNNKSDLADHYILTRPSWVSVSRLPHASFAALPVRAKKTPVALVIP